jgi:hypothetical protein
MQHSRSPGAVNLLHLFWDFNPTLFAELLLITGLGEEWGWEACGLFGSRVKQRWQGLW